MTEFKLTIAVEAPDIASAINNLAESLRNRPVIVPSVSNVISPVTDEKPATNATAPTVPVSDANPTAAVEAASIAAVPTLAPQNVPVEAVQTSPTVETNPVQPSASPIAAQTAAQTAPVAPVQVNAEAKSYTIEDITKAGSELLDNGKMSDLMNLLAQHGVQAVTMLKPEQFASVAAGLKKLGAKI